MKHLCENFDDFKDYFFVYEIIMNEGRLIIYIYVYICNKRKYIVV